MGMVIVYAALMILLNLLADLVYAWLDPRVRQEPGS
jgi:oligopeptide transport system permease protein